MGAAAEYYGYLLSQGYGKSQLKEFSEIAGRAERGEISHNQAYKQACKAGFGQVEGDGWENAEGEEGTKKTFGDWVNTAQEAGWIDIGLGLIGGFIQKQKGKNSGGGGGQLTAEQLRAQAQEIERLKEEQRSRKIKIGIGIGVAVLAAVGVVVIIVNKNRNK